MRIHCIYATIVKEGKEIGGAQICAEICASFVGLSLDAFKASVVVATLTVGMLVLVAASLALAIVSVLKIRAPTVTTYFFHTIRPQYRPFSQLGNALQPQSSYFMSHVWATGQDDALHSTKIEALVTFTISVS